MRKKILYAIIVMASVSFFIISCKKEIEQKQKKVEIESLSADENSDAHVLKSKSNSDCFRS